MRKVEFCKTGFYGGTMVSTPSEFSTGLFHGFFTEGNINDGVNTWAAIEKDDGTMSFVAWHKIKFLDKQEE